MNKLLLLFMFVLAATGLQAQSTKTYTLALVNEKGKRLNTSENKVAKLDMRAAKALKLQLLDKKGRPVAFKSMNFTCTGKDNGAPIYDGVVSADGMPPAYILKVMSEWVLAGKMYVENIKLNDEQVKDTFVIEVLP